MRSAFLLLVVVAASLAATPHGASPAMKETYTTTNLVQYIANKDFDRFMNELSTQTGLDIDQATQGGKFPLIEAVRSKELRFVDTLIMYGADLHVRERNSGATALHVAFSLNLPEIVSKLLSYGANPKLEDNKRKNAFDMIPSKGVTDLLQEAVKKWEKEGAEGFEDAVWTWTSHKDLESGEMYWQNRHTGESRWDTPPSCGWQRIEMPHSEHTYHNSVTGQTLMHRKPKQLCWVHVRIQKEHYYHNYVTDQWVELLDAPGEVPKDLLDEIDHNTNRRWHNEKTDEYTWEDPALRSSWKEVREEGSEQAYYFNLRTGESTWEVPEELAWAEKPHDSGPFWHNSKTDQVQWDIPEIKAWVRDDSEL